MMPVSNPMPSDTRIPILTLMFLKHTFFVTDQRQTFGNIDWPLPTPDPQAAFQAEEVRRMELRSDIFPDIPL
jgi:hypothetical protein